MRTRRAAKLGGWTRPWVLNAKVAAVREKFRAAGKPVPGVSTVVKWLLGKSKEAK